MELSFKNYILSNQRRRILGGILGAFLGIVMCIGIIYSSISGKIEELSTGGFIFFGIMLAIGIRGIYIQINNIYKTYNEYIIKNGSGLLSKKTLGIVQKIINKGYTKYQGGGNGRRIGVGDIGYIIKGIYHDENNNEFVFTSEIIYHKDFLDNIHVGDKIYITYLLTNPQRYSVNREEIFYQ